MTDFTPVHSMVNTDDRYGTVHKALHWTIAICVLMMLTMGIVMGDIPNGPDKFWVYGIHKSLGITILALMLVRLAWKLFNHGRPKPHYDHPRYERILAGIVHWGFYALLIIMPLSGYLGTGAANSTINWFGFFTVPNVIGADPSLRDFFFSVHYIVSILIWVFLGLHLAGVLKHVIVDKDDTLRRMVPYAAFMLMMLPGIVLAADKPTVWTIAREKSSLTFEATQEGGPFTGSFSAFDGQIMFDADAPEKGSARIIIDLNSIDTANPERDKSVKEPGWFDLATMPTAAYVVTSFEKGTEKDTYIAKGSLRLHGVEKPLDLPFTLDIADGDRIRTAHAVGKTTLRRLDFDVGSGQWADPSMVGNDVVITIDLTATAKDE